MKKENKNYHTNLVGINGRIGHGKDTVGKIIQCLMQGLNSKKQIIDYCNGVPITGFNWQIKKFASGVKKVASLLTGVPIEKWEDQEFKKQQMPEEWGMTYREFLQKIGTDAMRDGLHENVWVNALFADYKSKPEFFGSAHEESGRVGIYPLWCITDMRFPNEMEAVKKRGGITIRVERPITVLTLNGKTKELSSEEWEDYKKSEEAKGWNFQEHPSETALDDAEFDYEIINDGSVEDLIEKVKEILIKEKLYESGV